MNYKRVYDDLISKSANRTEKCGYMEYHHILPRSLGGSDDKSNIAILTGREHFIAHKLLAKIYGGPMIYAFSMMCRVNVNEHGTKRYNVKSTDYEMFKRMYSEIRRNTPISEEQKAKISASQRLRLKDPAERAKYSKRKGIPNTDIQKAKISDKLSGVPKKKVAPCPWCGKICNKATAVRWHYDNCKRKIQ